MSLLLRIVRAACVLAMVDLALLVDSRAELPNPVLQAVYPLGVQAGSTAAVAIEGGPFDGLRDLHCTAPGFSATKTTGNQFSISIPGTTPAGIYDLRAVTDHGLSSPRAFVVSRLVELLEGADNDSPETATNVELNHVVNGKIEKPGDIDCFRFSARRGELIVLECWAERIDSQLRGVLEVYDAQGVRLMVNRGRTGLDPRIDFRAPADGVYTARLFDLSYLGGNTHFYRLDIDTQPRPEFAWPCVVRRGETSRVRIWGQNLSANGPSTPQDSLVVEITPPLSPAASLPLPRRPAQQSSDLFAYHLPNAHAPLAIGLTDLPVIENHTGHEQPDRALKLPVPCEVSAQLATGYAQHWYTLSAKRGEVLWLEAWGDRIGSPVDLELSVFDASGQQALANLSDELENLGGYRYATNHSDPGGRFVVPGDGDFLVLVRNVIGGSDRDPRRIYRLSVRREEPDFDVAVIARRADQPAAWNIPRGGREWVEVLVSRQRGMNGAIRILPEQLPPGFECPETWLGPGQDRVPLVVTASRDAPVFAGAVEIIGQSVHAGVSLSRRAQGGTMIWSGRPQPSGRQTQEIPLATGLPAPFVLTAAPRVASLGQESVLVVDVTLETRADRPVKPVLLSAVGLPRDMDRGLVTLTADAQRGAMSFFWPASLPPGKYSFAIQAEVEAMIALAPTAKPTKNTLTLISNPITIELTPARIVLGIDPTTPTKIGRGKISQLKFYAQRVNGFLGKVHVELVAPEGVVGLRARGVTLTGQTDSGSLQVIATDNAPLGKHAQLRLDAVGTVEDQPVFRASRFVELEIVE